ncbi:hypothetical protein U1Q18_033010 [Sarracenia purpurea var. burkii]
MKTVALSFCSQIGDEDGGLMRETSSLSFLDRKWRERSRLTRERSKRYKKSMKRSQTKAILERRRSTTTSRRSGGGFIGEGASRSSDYVAGGGDRAGVDGG